MEHVRTRTQRRDWESRISKHATAAFEIDGWDERIYDEQEGAKLARAQVKKTFRGDIEGESITELLLAYTQEGSAAYAG